MARALRLNSSSLLAVGDWPSFVPREPIEVLATIGVVLTPFALLADYRLNLAPLRRTITYLPPFENGGRPVTYLQLVGWTQILWISIGLTAIALPQTRAGYRRPPTVFLAVFTGFLTAVTAATGGIDSFAARALFATLIPLIAIFAVLMHPRLSRAALDGFIAYVGLVTVAVIVATAAKDAAGHMLNQRFSLFLYGSPTYAAAAFATLIFVVIAATSFGVWARAGVVAILVLGIGLTQTRGGMAALVAGFLVIAATRRGLRLPAAAVAIAIAVLLAVGPGRSLNDASNSIRVKDVTHHLHLFSHHPFFGYGLSQTDAFAFTGADNTFVGIADAAGCIGLLMWCAAWLVPLKSGLRARGDVRAAAAAAAIVALVVTWITTGNEVLIYASPINLLPAVLGLSILDRPWWLSGRAAGVES